MKRFFLFLLPLSFLTWQYIAVTRTLAERLEQRAEHINYVLSELDNY